MKRILLTVMLASSVVGLFAQKLDKAKTSLEKKKLAEAKTEIDNFLAVDKNQANSEAWYTKSKIYLAINADSSVKATVPDARVVAFDAIKKYLELESTKDSTKRNTLLTMDGNKPLVDIYSAYSKDGASFYNAGNFNDALTNFQKSLEVFDIMSKRNMIPLKLDTTTTLYAGISAEKANKPDTAAVYYGKIAESKAKAEGFVEIYKWLADHYRQKNDMANATKYATLGREVYPQETFWSGFELDMAREKGTKDELFTKYEQVIKENPDNHLFYFNYGVELYQAGYNQDSTKRPANSTELIERATQQIAKSIEKKADYANSQMLMGQILYNQGVDINNKNKAIRPSGGAKLKPDELKKKEDLRVEMNKKFDEALNYFTKVDQILGSQGKLKLDDKNILKDAYDLTITIYEQKQMGDKVTEFTTKFNDVDKKH
ncbi:hypothetical protein [Flavitalea sp.]|nr:hypothetical protein [Flavitalea sp.]